MKTNTHGRTIAAAALVTGLLLAGGARAQAQETQPDPRWYAWIGCWQPAGAPAAPGADVPTLCVVPAAGSAGVDVVTVADGAEVGRERRDATGTPRRADRENCTGVTTDAWSEDGHRLFRRTEYTCPGGVQRHVEGLMALSPTGEWLEVQRLGAGEEGGVRVLRHTALEDLSGVPAGLRAALDGHALAASTTRMAAASTVSLDDVAEAARRLEAESVQAWLVERGQGFRMELDADRLVALAEAGVPAEVTDMVVALSYPDRFAINTADAEAELRQREAGGAPQPRYRPGGWTTIDPFYGGWGFGGFGYGMDRYRYDRYGYGGYGGYGGYYAPRVIVVRGSDEDSSRPEGRVVRGRGYTRTRGGGEPTSRPSSGPSDSRGSSGSAGGASPSGGSGSSGSGRTAKPRS